jgi:hypothetical protein
MRQLKHHEQKLLKKVNFLRWKNEHNLRELQVGRAEAAGSCQAAHNRMTAVQHRRQQQQCWKQQCAATVRSLCAAARQTIGAVLLYVPG